MDERGEEERGNDKEGGGKGDAFWKVLIGRHPD